MIPSSNLVGQFDALLLDPRPPLALAPMQDVTDLPFWRIMSRYGGPDVFFTEYFRVHSTSNLDKDIVRAIVENPSGRPVIAQMIGNDIPALVRTARELQKLPVAGIDLNLGCPAPVVYRKCAGGGLLREPEKVDGILQALRETIAVKFTVKTRIGFDNTLHWERLLEIFRRNQPDLVTVHGRTVLEMYRPLVHHDYIAHAVRTLACPVLANGNVDSVDSALHMLELTNARGLMIGRGAVRNPWVFQQIRDHFSGQPIFVPRGKDLLDYVHQLYEAVKPPVVREEAMVQKMKKYMNFLAAGQDPEGQFLHEIRRAVREAEFFKICTRYLEHDRPLYAPRASAPALHQAVA